jgi:protein-tyrosine phosphatase
MEPDETSPGGVPFVPYVPVVKSLAMERGIEVDFARFPIRDVDIPTSETMRAILAWIDSHVAAERPCYVHCWGGRGRTGTVAGVHLIRRGAATPENFVQVIRALRGRDSGGGEAPETPAQRNFVREFARSAASEAS